MKKNTNTIEDNIDEEEIEELNSLPDNNKLEINSQLKGSSLLTNKPSYDTHD
jgi:hypothetical protein